MHCPSGWWEKERRPPRREGVWDGSGIPQRRSRWRYHLIRHFVHCPSEEARRAVRVQDRSSELHASQWSRLDARCRSPAGVKAVRSSPRSWCRPRRDGNMMPSIREEIPFLTGESNCSPRPVGSASAGGSGCPEKPASAFPFDPVETVAAIRDELTLPSAFSQVKGFFARHRVVRRISLFCTERPEKHTGCPPACPPITHRLIGPRRDGSIPFAKFGGHGVPRG